VKSVEVSTEEDRRGRPSQDFAAILSAVGAAQQNACKDLTHNAVEFRTLVAHWSTLSIFVFACTELAEVFSCLGDSVTVQLHFYAAQRLS
jgi:hypothetical protein